MDVSEIVRAFGGIWLIIDWIIRIAALFIVPRNRKPTAGTAWLLFIFLVPTVGFLVFMILGNPKLPKGRRNTQETLNVAIRKVTSERLGELRIKLH